MLAVAVGKTLTHDSELLEKALKALKDEHKTSTRQKDRQALQGFIEQLSGLSSNNKRDEDAVQVQSKEMRSIFD